MNNNPKYGMLALRHMSYLGVDEGGTNLAYRKTRKV